MHCLHTQIQLLINSNVLFPRGDFFLFYLFIVIIITIVIFFIVFYHLNLLQSTAGNKSIYLEFYKKKKKVRIYSIFNQKGFKGICCFFRAYNNVPL